MSLRPGSSTSRPLARSINEGRPLRKTTRVMPPSPRNSHVIDVVEQMAEHRVGRLPGSQAATQRVASGPIVGGLLRGQFQGVDQLEEPALDGSRLGRGLGLASGRPRGLTASVKRRRRRLGALFLGRRARHARHARSISALRCWNLASSSARSILIFERTCTRSRKKARTPINPSDIAT